MATSGAGHHVGYDTIIDHLDFYAGKMCITVRYLSTMIRKASGVTAKEWLDRALVTQAKVMLSYSSRNVAQIADELNFPTSSFFCKFFKRMTGLTPQQYRRLDQENASQLADILATNIWHR